MMTTRSFRIHGPRGIIERAAEALGEHVCAKRTRTVADNVPVTEIMSQHVVCAFPDLPLDTLIEVMVRERLGSMPVVDERGHPVGMVTKLDIVEQLVVPNQRGVAPLVAEVMMPLAITLEDNATVAHAAALMASEDMHHVMIVSDRRLVGVVSTMDVTRWLANNDGIPS
jgi:CBS domain-containing protein